MPTRTPVNIIVISLLAVLALTVGCAKPDRSEEADRVTDELKELMFKDTESLQPMPTS